MIRTFIEVPIFTKRWKEKNAIKKLVKALKEEVAKNRRLM